MNYIDPFGNPTNVSSPYIAEQSVNDQLVVIYRDVAEHLELLEKLVPEEHRKALRGNGCYMENRVCKNNGCDFGCELFETGFIRKCFCGNI